MIGVSAKQGAGMAASLERVNGHKATGDVQALIRRLQDELHEARQTIRNQEFELAMLKRDKGISIKGRAVISPKEAATRLGVSLSTINRALNRRSNSRQLEGVQDLNGQWRVYADSLPADWKAQPRSKARS